MNLVNQRVKLTDEESWLTKRVFDKDIYWWKQFIDEESWLMKKVDRQRQTIDRKVYRQKMLTYITKIFKRKLVYLKEGLNAKKVTFNVEKMIWITFWNSAWMTVWKII